MKDFELISLLKEQLRQSAGWEGDEIATDRVHAWNYYFQRARGDEVNGRSKLVDGTVSSMVEANMAQMLDAFSSDNIVEFDPTGPEDEDQAQLESDVVAYYVMKKNRGFLQLAQAIKSALAVRNGVMKTWCDETERAKTVVYEGVTPDALSELPDGRFDEDKGTLTVVENRTVKQLHSESVEISNFHYPKTWDSFDLQNVPFCAERHVTTRGELISRGYPKKKVQQLAVYNTDASKPDSQAQNPGSLLPDGAPSLDPSQDRIEWYECYVLMDTDGDGIAERRRIILVYADDVILEDEPVSHVPYSVAAVMLNPHRLTGVSQYDKLRQVQDERTGLRRGRADNINTVTKNRLAYLDGKVNVDDVGDGSPNGGLRVKANVGDIRTAVMPFAVPDTSGPIGQALAETKSDRTEMGGAALELASGQMQIGGDRMGSQGLDRAYSVMEQLAAMMTKIVAATLIEGMFRIAHLVMRENFDTPVNIKRNGKWLSAIPSEWPERDSLTVKIGMSPGERARKAQALKAIVDSQIVLAEKGMDDVLVNMKGFHRAFMDWARLSEVQNPEQYFVDPESDESKEAMQSKKKAAAEKEQMQQQLMTQAVELEKLRTAMDKYKADQETQYKYWDAVLKSEVEEAKIVGKATAELVKARDGSEQGSGATPEEPAVTAAT